MYEFFVLLQEANFAVEIHTIWGKEAYSNHLFTPQSDA